MGYWVGGAAEDQQRSHVPTSMTKPNGVQMPMMPQQPPNQNAWTPAFIVVFAIIGIVVAIISVFKNKNDR